METGRAAGGSLTSTVTLVATYTATYFLISSAQLNPPSRVDPAHRYVDPGKHQREYALAQRKKNVTEKAFYPPKPPVKSVGKVGWCELNPRVHRAVLSVTFSNFQHFSA